MGTKSGMKTTTPVAKNSAVRSGIIIATVCVLRRARLRAARFGTYPTFAIAAFTRATVLSVTRGDPLMTRDAVELDI